MTFLHPTEEQTILGRYILLRWEPNASYFITLSITRLVKQQILMKKGEY